MTGASAPLSTLEVFINTNPMVKASKAGEAAMKELGFSARILGRDIMRFSGVMTTFATVFGKAFSFMQASSLDLGAAMEDLTWGLQDIFAEIGDAVAPILEVLADIIGRVADAFENLPGGLKMVIGLFILGGFVVLTLGGLLTKLWGALVMLKGAFIGTQKGASPLFDKLRNAIPWFTGMSAETRRLAEINTLLQSKLKTSTFLNERLEETENNLKKAMQSRLGTSNQSASSLAQQKIAVANLQAAETSYRSQLGRTEIEMADLIKEQTSLQEGQKAQKKSGKGVVDTLKSVGSTVENLALTLGPMAILMLALGPIIEVLSPILEAIGNAFTDVFEALSPVIDMIVQFIEDNEELVVAILLSLAGVMLFYKFIPGLSSALGKLGGAFGDLTKGVEETGGAEDDVSGSTWKNVAAMAALILALTPLLLAINEILKTVGTFKMSLADLFGYLGTLALDIIGITGALVFFIRSMSGLEADTYKAVGVLIALSGAVDIMIGMFTLFLSVIGKAGMNVTQVVGFLFSLAGAIGVLLTVMTGIIVILNSFSGQIIQGAAAMIVMTVPLLMLMAGFTGMFAALAAIGGNIWDMIAAMYAFVGAALALFAGMSVLVGVFAALSDVPFVWMGVALMYALAGAALLTATAFLVFSEAVQNLANAFISVMTASQGFFNAIIGSIPQMGAALGIILGLGVAFIGLGMSLLVAMPGLFLGAAGITAIAASIYLLAGAIGTLAGALNSIPPWATGMVGGFAGLVGGVLGAIPMMQTGGVVEKGGVAYLEPAEVVVPPGGGGAGIGAGSIYNTFNIQATIREEGDIDKLAKKISELQSKQYGGKVY